MTAFTKVIFSLCFNQLAYLPRKFAWKTYKIVRSSSVASNNCGCHVFDSLTPSTIRHA